MTGRKTSESYFAISSLQSPVCGPRSSVSALGAKRVHPTPYTLHPTPYFHLGVLCPVEYLLDQDRVVLPKRYSTGEVIVNPIC